jgi:diguanylate cyclase (GGDEF)-like protein/PAS domain S-box-containing protein
MSDGVLLVVPNALEASTIRASLNGSADVAFDVECVFRCRDGLQRLRDHRQDAIAAVVLDLFLPDSQGIETLEAFLLACPLVPILVVSRAQDESTAIRAVQQGAQDYLLLERVDGYTLPKALRGMLTRSARAKALGLDATHAQVTLDAIGDAVITTDVAGNVTYLNPIAESMTGWSRLEALARPLSQVLHIIDVETREPRPNPLSVAMLRDTTVGLGANCALIRRDGFETAIEDTAAPIHDERGQVTGAVIVFHDVGVAREMSLRMSHLAQHDSLTGLPNRLLLNDRLGRATALARRHRSSLAVLFVDVDRFKHVNDTLGHAIGDQLLQSIARRLVACVRSSDTVSRLGGDEFVVLLPELARGEEAALSAQKILDAMSLPQHIDRHDLHVTVSIGIGVFPCDGTDPEMLLKSADTALFNAKAEGRGVYRFFAHDMSLAGVDTGYVRTGRVGADAAFRAKHE